MKTVILTASLITTLVMVGCLSSPLGISSKKPVVRIELSSGATQRASITSTDDISFILSRLNRIPTYSDFKIITNINAVFIFSDETTLKLRFARECVGPNVPGSQYAKRWYFKNPELYEFLERRLKTVGSNK